MSIPLHPLVTPTAIRNSWKKLMQLPSSAMQNSDPLEETKNSEFIKQLLRINITLQMMISKAGWVEMVMGMTTWTSKELLH